MRVPLRRSDGYAPIESYAPIGDGRTVALISDDGRIDWFPVPDLDCPPIFGALLDADDGGHLALAPVGPARRSREYLTGTNILVTTYTMDSGAVRVTDSLNSGVAGRLPWTELARRIEGLRGHVEMQWAVRPGSRLGESSPWMQERPTGPVLRSGDVAVAVHGIDHHPVTSTWDIHGSFTTDPGSRHLIGLTGTRSEPLNLPDPADIDRRIEGTVDSWRAWSDSLDYDGEWAPQVLRHALILKQLIFSPTGAVAAAATTSLPESPAGGKNWDYRYAWVRDAAHTIRALIRIGAKEEIHAAVSWMLQSLRRHGAHVFTHLSGEPPSGRRTAPGVPGWRGIGPVLSGNGAAEQLQLGAFGDIFDVVRSYVEAGHLLDPDTGAMLADLADQCCDQWRRPDAGIWELPDEQHYTSSKIGCWQALTCAIELAECGQIPGRGGRWRTERQAIRDFIVRHCWNDEIGCYVKHPGTDELDASILLASGFDDGARMSSTIDAVRDELADGPLVYRYSGMQNSEGAFVACSFWLVGALARVGRSAEARQLMDELLPLSNDVGIFAEMIVPADGPAGRTFLGNLPQGLSHLSLINAALAVDAGRSISAPSVRPDDHSVINGRFVSTDSATAPG